MTKRRPKKLRAACLTKAFVYVRSDQMGDGYLKQKFDAIRETQRKAQAEAAAKVSKIGKAA